MENLNLPILITNIISATIILIVAMITVRVLKRGIQRLEQKDIESNKKQDITQYNFLKNSIGIVVYSIAAILIINTFPATKQLGTALFAGAGVLAAVVGFASQQAFSNIISGIFILIFKPFRIGDIVEISNNLKGEIVDITLRHTIIKDYENRRIIIPNSIISDETIVNCSIDDERIKKHIEIGISYDSNIDKAIEIIIEEIKNHPLLIDIRTPAEKKAKKPQIPAKVVSLSDSSVDIRAYAWTTGQDNAFILKCDVLKSIKERFDREGIDIPYPHRTVIAKSMS